MEDKQGTYSPAFPKAVIIYMCHFIPEGRGNHVTSQQGARCLWFSSSEQAKVKVMNTDREIKTLNFETIK